MQLRRRGGVRMFAFRFQKILLCFWWFGRILVQRWKRPGHGILMSGRQSKILSNGILLFTRRPGWLGWERRRKTWDLRGRGAKQIKCRAFEGIPSMIFSVLQSSEVDKCQHIRILWVFWMQEARLKTAALRAVVEACGDHIQPNQTAHAELQDSCPKLADVLKGVRRSVWSRLMKFCSFAEWLTIFLVGSLACYWGFELCLHLQGGKIRQEKTCSLCHRRAKKVNTGACKFPTKASRVNFSDLCPPTLDIRQERGSEKVYLMLAKALSLCL